MARKLKVFQTSLGFYEEIIAAPSMKAALEIWGAKSNLFHQGMARESTDPDAVAAAISKPGVILKRPVGSNAQFKEHAELPSNFSSIETDRQPREPRPKAKKPNADPIYRRAVRKASLASEKEERRRLRQCQKEEAGRAKESQRRRQAVEKAQAALEQGQREHDRRMATIDAERASLEQRSQSENRNWEANRKRLQGALRRASE